MTHILPSGGGTALMNVDDAALLLLDHQTGLFQTVKDITAAELRAKSWRSPGSPLAVQGKWASEDHQGRRRLRTSGAVAANTAALLGLGIANGPLYLVRSLLDRGAIELILTDYEPPTVPCHAVWPATKVLPARTQLFVEFLAARLLKERL